MLPIQIQQAEPYNRWILFGFMFLLLLTLGLWVTFATEGFVHFFRFRRSVKRPLSRSALLAFRILGVCNLVGAAYVLVVRLVLGRQ